MRPWGLHWLFRGSKGETRTFPTKNDDVKDCSCMASVSFSVLFKLHQPGVFKNRFVLSSPAGVVLFFFVRHRMSGLRRFEYFFELPVCRSSCMTRNNRNRGEETKQHQSHDNWKTQKEKKQEETGGGREGGRPRRGSVYVSRCTHCFSTYLFSH